MTLRLTPEEARLLYEALAGAWIPSQGYADFRHAVAKLRKVVETPSNTQEKT